MEEDKFNPLWLNLKPGVYYPIFTPDIIEKMSESTEFFNLQTRVDLNPDHFNFDPVKSRRDLLINYIVMDGYIQIKGEVFNFARKYGVLEDSELYQEVLVRYCPEDSEEPELQGLCPCMYCQAVTMDNSDISKRKYKRVSKEKYLDKECLWDIISNRMFPDSLEDIKQDYKKE